MPEFSKFLQLLNPYLNPTDIAESNNNIFKLFGALERKGELRIGKYDILKNIFQKIDVQMVELIQRREEQIRGSRVPTKTETTEKVKKTRIDSTATPTSGNSPPAKVQKLDPAEEMMTAHVKTHHGPDSGDGNTDNTDFKCENEQEPMNIEPDVRYDDEEPVECESDYEIEKSEIEVSEKAEQDNTKSTFQLRSYQKELAEKALKGDNTIICADTNTGKTWVALFVAKSILESSSHDNIKIVFMARTNPLVVQQFNLFKRFLPDSKVIGLTATIGVGNATSDKQAVDYMLKICANLDVKTIATVEDNINIEEMRKHTSRPKEEQMRMKERHGDPCKVEIIQTMKKIEKVLDESMTMHPELFSRIKERPINDYQSKKYQQWLVTTMKTSVSLLTGNDDISRQIVSAIQYLLSYNEALDINYLMNVQDVLEHVAEKCRKEKSHQSSLTDYELNLLSLCEGAINPNLPMLVKILKNKFLESKQDSRGIVFVETLATAFSLAKYLDSEFVEVNAKCRAFTGNKTSENAGGMGETEKKALLEIFKSGHIKLLVSTSVGSEGIDIPECNIVVTYNYSGNEVTVIQMRGRLREKGGTAVHLGDYKTQHRDSVNMQKAAMMYRALEMLKKLDKSEKTKRIVEFQRQDMSSEAVKQHTEQIKLETKIHTEFRMKCFKCKTFVVDSNQIRKYAKCHHVVTDPTFFDRIIVKPVEEKKRTTFENMTKHSKVLCKKCTNITAWGVLFRIDGHDVPMLKSEPFVFENVVSGKDTPYKKWKDVPYKIHDIEKDELLQLLYQITE